jgi:hypothetical protein
MRRRRALLSRAEFAWILFSVRVLSGLQDRKLLRVERVPFDAAFTMSNSASSIPRSVLHVLAASREFGSMQRNHAAELHN